MKIYIGADHRGLQTKDAVKAIVSQLGYSIEDVGTYSESSCDYPKIAYKVGTAVAGHPENRGILICMSGIGQAIAANKIDGVLAALCYNAEAAALSRQHNNANVLVLSTKFIKSEDLEEIVKVWLSTEFEGGRHQRRVDLIRQMETGADISQND